jgi:hypothetical protein
MSPIASPRDTNRRGLPVDIPARPPLTADKKPIVAKRLRGFAAEYAKLTSRARGVRQMVDDLLDAANVLDPPGG